MADIAKAANINGTETLLDGACKLLGHLWDAAWQNAHGTLSGDANALHDMRVAVRRARSALQNFEGDKKNPLVAPHVRRELKTWRKTLGQLGDVLGAVRDYDVLNKYLDDYAKKRLCTEIEDDSGLAELRRHFLNERPAAFAKMVKRINKAKRPLALREEFARYILGLPAASGPNPLLSAAVQPMIAEHQSEALLHAPSLQNPHDETGQHELRKSLKRLRYTFELFAPCFEDSPQSHIKQISKLQDTLGEMQDRSVLHESVVQAFGEDAAQWPEDVAVFVRYGTERRHRLLTQARKQWAALNEEFLKL